MKNLFLTLLFGLVLVLSRPVSFLAQTLPWQVVSTIEGAALVSGIGTDSVILGSTGFGLFRSADNGVTWKQMFTDVSTCKRGGLFVKTPTSLLLFSDAMYRSTDKGLTWQAVSTLQLRNVVNLNGNFYGNTNTANVIYRSSDNGETWSPIYGLTLGYITKMIIFNKRLIAVCQNGTASNCTVFQSLDGMEWTALQTPLEGKSIYDVNIASDAERLYALVRDTGYFMSADSGKTWNSINANLPDSLAKTLTSSTPLLPFRSFLFTTNRNGVYRFSPQTGEWSQLGMPQDLRYAFSLFASDNGALFVGTPRGTFRSLDTGRTWQSVRSGLRILSGGYFVTSINGKIFSNSADHSWGQYSSDNGQTWEDPQLESTAIGVLHYFANIGNTLVSVSSDGGYVSISKDGGRTWKLIIDQVPNIYSVRSLLASGNILFAMRRGGGLCQSSDTGKTWVFNATTAYYGEVYTLSKIDNTLYIATQSGFFRSRDNGDTWDIVNKELFYDIFVLNNQTYIGYVIRQMYPFIFDGYRITRNGGMTWDNLSMPQGETSLRQIIPFGSSILALFGNNAIFLSKDMARTWTKLTNTGLPEAYINKFTLHGSSLFASFECNGLYRTDLTTVSAREGPQNTLFISSPAPNPSTDYTDLAFTLPRAAQAGVTLYSTLGTEVWRSEGATMSAGEQHIRIDTRHLPTGVYAYRLMVDGVSSVGRIVVVR
jgi:photosystem II stability/assembly factor-like uncharacterized protein